MKSCFRRLFSVLTSDLAPYFIVLAISLFATGLLVGKEM